MGLGYAIHQMDRTQYYRELGLPSLEAYLQSHFGQSWKVAYGYWMAWRWRSCGTLKRYFLRDLISPIALWILRGVVNPSNVTRWCSIAAHLTHNELARTVRAYLKHQKRFPGPTIFLPLWVPSSWWYEHWRPHAKTTTFETLEGLCSSSSRSSRS